MYASLSVPDMWRYARRVAARLIVVNFFELPAFLLTALIL